MEFRPHVKIIVPVGNVLGQWRERERGRGILPGFFFWKKDNKMDTVSYIFQDMLHISDLVKKQ